MFRPIYAFLGIATIITLTACVGQQQEPYKKNEGVKRSGVNITNLYNDTCAKCHGNNAQGGGGGTKSLLTVDKFDQKWDKPFFDATRNGVPDAGMEGYGQTMSDEEIWALVVHIRELQNKAVRGMTAPKPVDDVYTSQYYKYKVETVLKEDRELKTPWSMDWLPDGKMLVNFRPGIMCVVENGVNLGRVEGLPESTELGQGGLMEVAVHPNYKKNGWIYLSIADPKNGDRRNAFTKIVRGKISFEGSKMTWSDDKVIFKMTDDNYTGAGQHFGGKIVFDGKGHIFFSTGERGNGPLAQRLDKPNGKIWRLNEDGSIPSDNPFVNTPNALPGIWTYGQRNPQGLAMDSNGDLWDTEHAPRGGDEVNHIIKGSNYGWPVISYGINYNDSSASVPWPSPDQKMKMSVYRWLPSTGASGLKIAKGSAFAKWKDDLIAGGLAGQNIDRIRIKNDKVVEKETLIWGMGRVRDLAFGPDGNLYVALNEPDRIVRLVPVK
ncbi:MAG: PQQ-dependent sugar dehydrogenase [Armatimonadota bacterium]